MKALAIGINTFREAVRNKILYSVVLFAFLIVGVSAVFGAVTMGSQIRVIKDFGLFSLSFFGAIITIISGVALLNKELKQKTIYNILSKPVSRWEFVFGKFIGLSITVSLLITLMGVALILFASLMESKIDLLLFQGILFAILETITVSSITIFFSSVVVTTTLTGLFTLGTFIAGRSISYLTYFTNSSEYHNPTVAMAVKVLNWILPDLSLFNVSDQLVYGHAVPLQHLSMSVIYTASYSMIMLFLAAMVFNRRELV